MKKFFFAVSFVLFINIGHTQGSEAGMPQLNPEFWAAQIFWLITIFVILYIIVWKVFLPKITHSIENRRKKIVNDLNEAEKLKEDAEKKLKEYKDIIDNSKKEAKKIIDDNNKKLDSNIESKKKKFTEEIEKELMEAEKEIKLLKKSSISNVGKISEEITAEVIKKIISTEVNKSSVSAIVNEITKKKVNKHL